MYPQISDPTEYSVALYIRLSKEDDSDSESESVANQRSLLLDYAEKQRLNVYDAYVDDGFSGTTFERPAFSRLIEDIEARRVNMVITKDMSRLGRDYIQTGHYLERYFPERRIRYISLLDGVDTGLDSTANDITPFRSIMNDMYAKDISKKIKSVKRDKQRKGLFIGGKAPYGYVLSQEQKNTLLIDPVAAEVVRRIFRLAAGGASGREIAVALNGEGIPPPAVYAGLPVSRKGPYTGLWSAERVSDMLKNRMYVGDMVQGKSRKASYKSQKTIKTPPKDWVVVEGTHPPLVERDVFEKVQMLLQSRRHTRSRIYDYPLKGILYCHECGYPLGVINRKLAGGREVLYTVCRTYQRFTKARRCTCHCIRLDLVVEAVSEQVKVLCERYLWQSDPEGAFEDAMAERQAQGAGELELSRLEAKIEKLSGQIDRLYEDRLSGLLDDADFSRLYGRLREERGGLMARREGLREQSSAPKEEIPPLRELAQSFLASIPHNRELLASLLERVELSEEKELFLYFRFAQME